MSTMSKLNNIAKSISGEGSEYISIDNLIANYPNGVTICGAHTRDFGKAEGVPCFTFAEGKGKFFCAVSGDLSKLFNAWLDDAGNMADLNDALKAEPVKIVINKIATKKGFRYVKIEVVEDAESVADTDAAVDAADTPKKGLPENISTDLDTFKAPF